MINLKCYPIFSNNLSNLKELSKDTSNSDDIQYMTEYQVEAVNFDAVKTEYANSLEMSEEVASSCDALLEMPESLVFIEFKNGSMKNAKRNVKDKIRDSLLIFCDIVNQNISATRESLDFILIYNIFKNPLPNKMTRDEHSNSSSRDAIGKYFMKKGHNELILFDLERFKNIYFREVHTYSKEEFAHYMKTINK